MNETEINLYCHGHRVDYVLECCFYDTEICEHTCGFAVKKDTEDIKLIKTGLERFIERYPNYHAQISERRT